MVTPFPSFEQIYPQGVQLSNDVIGLLEKKSLNKTALSFDEISLEDKPTELHPQDVRLHSFATRKIRLKGCGLLSAAMDTVTEKEMALAMAKMGGMGILHRNLDPETQASMVKWVRRKIHYGGMIDKPITFLPEDRFSHVQRQMTEKGYHFTSFPIVSNNKLLGLLTRDEMEFVEGSNPTLSEIMKPRNHIVVGQEDTNTEQAYKIMRDQKVKKLPIVDSEDQLIGMYVWNDVKNDQRKRDLFSLDEDGHFLVGAAVGLSDSDILRADLLVSAGCKVLVLDSSHGSCLPCRNQIATLRKKHGETIQIIAGNIASYDSAMFLLDTEHKPDALKVGIGPGSICTTRSVTGHGVPQVTAVYQVWRAVRDFGDRTGYYVPIIADGGIRTSGDIVKCLAVGASSVMLGSVFAGTLESPGQIIVKGGKRYKSIRGMGSRSAMEDRSGSRVRYSQNSVGNTEQLTNEQKQKIVPEGVEGLVQYKGSVEKVMNELLGGIQAGIAHTGGKDIVEFQKRATIWTQGYAGIIEGKPHDILDIRD